MKAYVHIQTSLREGITYLKKSYFTPPFKVANITEDKTSEKLQLMLMCSSPGILDEDDYTIKIDLDKDCSLQLHTQSYQRLFNMQKGATQLVEINLQEGASFEYLPHPSVPHEQSIFTTKNKIYLKNDCSLIWGEVLTCGRKLNGELFRFSKYHTITEVFVNDKLVVKENLLMQPSLINVNAIGQLEGFTHQASLICLNENILVEEVMESISECLSGQAEMVFGITAAPVNGFILRLLGYKAEQLYDAVKSVAGIIHDKLAEKV